MTEDAAADRAAAEPAGQAAAGPAAPAHAGFAYLLVQLGAYAATQFAEEIAPLGVEPRHVGMLTRLAANEGKAQQVIGDLIGLNPTQMVFLVDELESRGFVQRRRNPADRRSYALYLTDTGRDMLAKVQAAGEAHQARLGSSLSADEREQLSALLRRIARAEGISEQSLPGVPRRRG
jgi:DNA-binding MarR family transcriptional regulator